MPASVPTDAITTDALLERKHPRLAAFVVVPAAAVARWKLAATTTVEGSVDGIAMGRRSLVRWDDDRWFIELRAETLAELGKEPGERVRLRIARASTELPPELRALLASEPAARARWERATPAQQRMLREEILKLKSAAARDRRARKELLPAAAPPAAVVPGLGACEHALRLRIEARDLPGRSCGPHREIQVGFVEKTGCAPERLTPADARRAAWETEIRVRALAGGGAGFRGPAVNGPPSQRFLYLTWIGREGKAPPAMFRRAKLRLDGVPAGVLADAVRSGVLVGKLGLTDGRGMPRCASVLPPDIVWEGGT